MTMHENRVKVLRSEMERVQGYLGGLAESAWTEQSACDLWEVRHVVAHLSGVSEFYATTVGRGLQGDISAPEGRPDPGTATGASSGDRIAQGAIANAEMLGDQLLATLTERDSQLVSVLAGLAPDNLETPCYHPGGIVPAGNFFDLRLKELALHEWDIRSPMDAEAGLSQECLPSMLILLADSLASGSLPWAFWPGPSLSTPVRYRFVVTQPAPISVDIAVSGDKVRLEDAGASLPDVTFRCDTETFLLLTNGRVTPAPAIAAGRLEVEGDSGVAADFGQWFKGI
jgi:uncharacterized protein (TIGR03083 family)